MKDTQTKKLAIAYCRVSSTKQTKAGDGLNSQETRCRDFARMKGYGDLVKVFYDDASGSLVDRPIVGRGSTKFVALQRAGGGALRSLSAVAKVSGVAAAVAIPYLAITRPQLVATAAGWVAEQIGMPAWLGVFLVFSALSLFLLFAVRLILAPILFVATSFNRLRPRAS